jgi:hypothetical protein
MVGVLINAEELDLKETLNPEVHGDMASTAGRGCDMTPRPWEDWTIVK